MQVGQSESVSRGQPSGGLVFWYDFSSGLSDQRGVNEGFCLILLAAENTCQMPLAAIDSPFSTYFIGACMQSSPHADGSGPELRASVWRRVRGPPESSGLGNLDDDSGQTARIAAVFSGLANPGVGGQGLRARIGTGSVTRA